MTNNLVKLQVIFENFEFRFETIIMNNSYFKGILIKFKGNYLVIMIGF